jgi:hypothetical protein
MKKIKTKKRKTVSHSDHGHKQGAGTKMMGETATTSRTIDDELLWYCSYGSNLSRSRFMTYISGGTPPPTIYSLSSTSVCTRPALLMPWRACRASGGVEGGPRGMPRHNATTGRPPVPPALRALVPALVQLVGRYTRTIFLFICLFVYSLYMILNHCDG